MTLSETEPRDSKPVAPQLTGWVIDEKFPADGYFGGRVAHCNSSKSKIYIT